MTDLLSIGTSATQLYRQALTTVSNNIANMNTDGYSRQEIVSVENTPTLQGVYYLGNGASVETVTRAYDAFAEENLRNSNSELGFQQPTINYANKIVDVMGSDAAGLSGAMDKFFAKANELTTNPSSTIMRSSFLSAADFLATRISSISGQLDSVGLEASADIDAGIKQVNGITEQLALLNRKMQPNLTEASQPAALLDNRDRLLRELSGLVKIDVKLASSGQVDVRLAGTGSSAGLVRGLASSTLNVTHGASSIDRSVISLDVIGAQQTGKGQQLALSGLQGGSLGGVLDFKNNLLQRTVADIDFFTKTLVTEVNDLHHAGVDLNGNLGGDLFRIDPVVEVKALGAGALAKLDISIENAQQLVSGQLMLTWDQKNNGFLVNHEGEDAFVALDSAGEAHIHGLDLKFASSLENGTSLTVMVVDRPAKTIAMVIRDEHEVAAASRLTATSFAGNRSVALPSIEYSNAPSVIYPVPAGIVDLSSTTVREFDASVTFNSAKPWAQIAAGTKNFSVELTPDVGSSVQLQLMTANGMQLFGGNPSDPDALMRNDFFDSSAVYSDAAMQSQTSASYRDLDFVYGFQAQAIAGAQNASVTVTSSSIPAQVNNTGLNKTIIEGGDLHLNGVALNDLILPTNGTLSATAVAAWLNQQTDATGVAAQATNLLKVESSRLSLGSSLELNNVAVPGAETVSSAQALVAVINQASMQTNVEAYLDSEGHITLANSPGHQGEPILVTSADVDGQNTLGIDAKSYSGQLVLTGAGSIQFDLITSAGHSGKPALLSALGLQTGLYFSGTLPEDMVVMVAAAETGATHITAKSGGLIDATNAPRTMEPAFSVAFSADGTYTLTEIESGSVLAKRTYDHSVGIQQGDLTITFDQVPSAGDQFLIQPRDADSGNNDMIVALAELQNASVFVGGNTFSSGYLKILNEVGSNSFSATIASDALEVVYQQAVEKRDSKVGVSLDQEAASLIRFQQAFQAAAQIIQTSSKLFDTILGASR